MLYRFSMRILPRSTGVALAALATLLLSGCLPSTPVVTPEPLPSSTPVFASDADALAAATDAYRGYTQAVDVALSSYDLQWLAEVALDAALKQATDRVAEYKSNEEHQVGRTTVESTSLVTSGSSLGTSGHDEPFQIYACLDLSDVNVFDSSGISRVDSDRPDRIPMIVGLTWRNDRGTFVVTEEDLWGGNGVC